VNQAIARAAPNNALAAEVARHGPCSVRRPTRCSAERGHSADRRNM
jgi:hypothetical protein